jgi:transposase InsO family protein
MPWNESTRMDERRKFVAAYLSGKYQMSELCLQAGVSRPTGYKWVGRFQTSGPQGLQDRSRAPHHCPQAMAEELQCWFIRERRAHPRWGPKKLRGRFRRLYPRAEAPSRSAIYRLLKRHGLIPPRTRRRRARVNAGYRVRAEHPNELWTIDFKGQFRTGDHRWCYPFTVMDSASRYLLACQAQYEPSAAPVSRTMCILFRTRGLPLRMHFDNGSPFASRGLGGLSRLSLQWLKLGIRLERSRAGCPQDNAAHERMHRTLKDDTARPPASNLPAQQRRFNRFHREYNYERPHETLHDGVPADFYQPSARSFPTRLPPPSYPGHFELRRVSINGDISWRNQTLYVGLAFVRETLGLEEVADGLWSMYFAHHMLARWDARSNQLIPLPV